MYHKASCIRMKWDRKVSVRIGIIPSWEQFYLGLNPKPTDKCAEGGGTRVFYTSAPCTGCASENGKNLTVSSLWYGQKKGMEKIEVLSVIMPLMHLTLLLLKENNVNLIGDRKGYLMVPKSGQKVTITKIYSTLKLFPIFARAPCS